MRTGVLSDHNVMKKCSKHQTLPMHMSHILGKPQTTTPYSSKSLKYPRQMSRPQTFDTLATQLSRNSGSVLLREQLHQALHNVITHETEAPATPAGPATPATPATPGMPYLENFPYLRSIQSSQQSQQGMRTQVPQTPGVPQMGTLATPANVPPRRTFQLMRRPGNIDNIFSYDSNQATRTQFPQTPGGLPMAALTPSPQGPNTGETRAGTRYLAYLPYIHNPSPVQNATL